MGRKDKRRKRVQQFVRDKNKVAANLSADRQQFIINKLVNENTPLIDKKTTIEDEIPPISLSNSTNDDTIVDMDAVHIQLSASKSNHSYHAISNNAEVPELDLNAVNNADADIHVNDTDICDNTVDDTLSVDHNHSNSASCNDMLDFENLKKNTTRQWATLILMYLVAVCIGIDQINMLINSGFISSSYNQLMNNVQIIVAFLLGISLIWHIPIKFDAKYLIIFSTLVMSPLFYATGKMDYFNGLLLVRFFLGMAVGIFYISSNQLIAKFVIGGNGDLINFFILLGSFVASLINYADWEWYQIDKIISGFLVPVVLLSWLVLPFEKANVNIHRLPSDLLIISIICILTKCTNYFIGCVCIIVSLLLFLYHRLGYNKGQQNDDVHITYNTNVNYTFSNMIKTINFVSILYIISLHSNIINYETPRATFSLISLGAIFGFLLADKTCSLKYSVLTFIVSLGMLFLNHWIHFNNSVINFILVTLTSLSYIIVMRSKIRKDPHESIDYISIITYMIIGLIICHIILHHCLNVVLRKQLLQFVDQDHSLRQILKIYRKSIRSITCIYKNAPSFAYDTIIDCYDDMFKISTVLIVLEIISIVFALALLV